MNILAFESSCDETAVAVVQDGRKVLSSIVASQTTLHALYGGVVPEIASRQHVECIFSLTEQALAAAGLQKSDIHAVACTAAPGLIGALLVGLNFAKTAAYTLGVPFIPVHHIRGHVASNYLEQPTLEPPFVALVVSGGHSSILHVLDYTTYQTIGVTRDDAAGECFDKVARVLGLGYPGGPLLDKLAVSGNPTAFTLPRSKVDGAPLDMSFSGLKTHVINVIHTASQRGQTLSIPDLAASFSQAVCDTLIPRVLMAAAQTGVSQIVLAGGVAANAWLRKSLQEAITSNYTLYMPSPSLCGDNAAMIGAQGFYEFQSGVKGCLSHNARATCGAHELLCKPI